MNVLTFLLFYFLLFVDKISGQNTFLFWIALTENQQKRKEWKNIHKTDKWCLLLELIIPSIFANVPR